jgi:hypothetical protein
MGGGRAASVDADHWICACRRFASFFPFVIAGLDPAIQADEKLDRIGR